MNGETVGRNQASLPLDVDADEGKSFPDLSTALDVFVRSFARSRSIISPAEWASIDSLLVVRDVPGHRRHPRGQEIFVPPTVDIGDALSIIQANTPEISYSVCVLLPEHQPALSTIAAMKASGFRYLRAEPMMMRSTTWSAPTATATVREVRTAEDAAAVAAFAGSRQLTAADFNQDPQEIRVFIGEADGEIVCYARSIHVYPGMTYLAGMYTAKSHRRRGIATAVLGGLLQAEARSGIVFNTLHATRDGKGLYDSMGYVIIGTLYVFSPRKT